MCGPLFVALGAVLASGATDADEAGESTFVVAESLDVLDGPWAASGVAGRLRRGDRVVVHGSREGDVVPITPPPGSFSWIEESAVERLGNHRARIRAAQAPVRSGRPGAKLPGAPCGVLNEGAVVRLLDRPGLTLGSGRAARTWLAIQPSSREVRYVRADGLALARDSARPPEEPNPVLRAGLPRIRDDDLIAVGPGPSGSSLPPEFARRLREIERSHRAALRGPVDGWRLGPIRASYEALAEESSDEATRALARSRVAQVRRQEEVARAARDFRATVVKSRARDKQVETLRGRAAEENGPDALPYDAEGMLQASSKLIEGQRVFALIGDDGNTTAYLSLPPGVSTDNLLSRRIGVRGAVHFSDLLRTRLIAVRDVDPLDD